MLCSEDIPILSMSFCRLPIYFIWSIVIMIPDPQCFPPLWYILSDKLDESESPIQINISRTIFPLIARFLTTMYTTRFK